MGYGSVLRQYQEWTFTPISAAVMIVLTFLVLAIAKTTRGNQHRLPPGPRGWPVLGSLPYLGKFPLGTFRMFAQKYGGLVLVHFGCIPVVIVGSAHAAKGILETNDHITASRPPPPVTSYFFSYNRLDILWSPYGPYWRNLRKICALKLFSASRIQQFQGTRRKEILRTLLDLLNEAQQGNIVNMRTYFSNLTYNNMSGVVFGKRFRNLLHTNAASTKDNSAIQMFQKGIATAVRINISDFLPWLRPLDLQGIEKEARQIHSEVDKYLQAILDEHTPTLPSSSAAKTDRLSGNFVEQLLEISAGSATDFPEGYLSPTNIKAILVDTIGASIETSTYAMEWTLAELLKHPEALRRAQEELDVVVGPHRLVNEADIPNLKYLQAVIKESLRLHPTVPMTVPHQAMADCEVAGYHIPSKTRICINIYAIHRDPAVWDRPLEFDPDRFLDSTVNVIGRNFECIPFGAGRRICPGMNLALLQLQHTMAQVLHTFDWVLPYAQVPEDFDMSEAGLFTHFRANPLMVLPKERLPVPVIYDAARAVSLS